MSRFIRRIINRRSVENLDHEVDNSPEDPEERVTIRNMRRIEKPKSMPWKARLSGSDMTKLLKGFQPSEMEQKWVIAASGPDDKGIIDVHLCRSWTSYEIYTVRVRVLAGEDGKPGDAEKNRGEVFEILYETSNEFNNTCDSEIEDMAVGLCRGFLGVELGKGPERPKPPVKHHRR
ncbi:hypothetical protein CEP54_013495 [Fusarium duplospermum]|uniref:Uncharacterized protein n=1 Tax=Fusarium duplospermum TaxID=1325734 RepID=A0A428P2M3_9HYPO|nr:hypothetical protein CEP54_013495 [Fusarium duplospermum]